MLNRIKKIFCAPLIQECSLVFAFIVFVLALNQPLISFNMLYPEQHLLYSANQNLHGFKELLHVYLHPALFTLYIPFFRPTGLFLMYQLIIPFIGWHNTQVLLMVNFIFLGLTGYLVVKIYPLLFPRMRYGAYVAFAFLLAHPALTLSKVIALHFEFAYVFFSMLSVYCLLLFCRDNHLNQTVSEKTFNRPFQHIRLFVFTLFFFIFAVTLKEPALMLGPIFVWYLYCMLFNTNHPFQIIKYSFAKRHFRNLLLLITVVTLSLAIYLTLAWPSLSNPIRHNISLHEKAVAGLEILNIVTLWHHTHIASHFLSAPDMPWRYMPMVKTNRYTIQCLILLTGIASFYQLLNQKTLSSYKKTLCFLFGSAFLLCLLPLNWAMALPWHLSLSILFIAFATGFCAETFIRSKLILLVLSLLIASTAIPANFAITQHYATGKKIGFALRVGKNALLFPPKIKQNLSSDSTIVIADHLIQDSYFLGAIGPELLGIPSKIQGESYAYFSALDKNTTIGFNPIENGRLFSWVYLMPHLQEEVLTFNVKHMNELNIANMLLYHWLKRYDDIFCLTYDNQANWHDVTNTFRKNLFEEQKDRGIKVNNYDMLPAAVVTGIASYNLALTFPNYEMCEYTCDQDKNCKGFTYQAQKVGPKTLAHCQFYSVAELNGEKFCSDCIGFVKANKLI